MVALTPRHTYNASLGLVLRALAHMRAGGALLHAAEWRMYSAALQSNCICQRMAAVATVSGDSEEVLPQCLSLSCSAQDALNPEHGVAPHSDACHCVAASVIACCFYVPWC